jgi:hypothetical protein
LYSFLSYIPSLLCLPCGKGRRAKKWKEGKGRKDRREEGKERRVEGKEGRKEGRVEEREGGKIRRDGRKKE